VLQGVAAALHGPRARRSPGRLVTGHEPAVSAEAFHGQGRWRNPMTVADSREPHDRKSKGSAMIGSESVFRECHQHIRTIEQRRDVAVGLLLTLVLGALTAVAALNDGEAQAGQLRGAIIAIAIAVFALLGSFRRWKLIHLHAASVFMRFPDVLPTRTEAEAAWDNIVKEDKSAHPVQTEQGREPRWIRSAALRFIAFSRSIDFLLLLISSAVSGIVAVPTLVRLLSQIQPWPKPVSWFLMIVLWAVVSVGTAGIAGGRVRSFPFYAWMFRGLMDSPKRKEEAPAQP
jgi:nitrate reductase NapE component